MSSPYRSKSRKRQRNLKSWSGDEDHSPSKQAKLKSNVPILRHRLFASPSQPNVSRNKNSLKTTRKNHNQSPKRQIKPEEKNDSSDSEEICNHENSANAGLKQLNYESDDRIVFAEHPEKSLNVDDRWKIDSSQEDSKLHKFPSSQTALHRSNGRRSTVKLPRIVGRNEVLPQQRILKIGDPVSVQQNNNKMGSGINSTSHRLETKDKNCTGKAKASQVVVHITPPRLSQKRDGCTKLAFLTALDDELRLVKEMHPYYKKDCKLPYVNFTAMAKSIAKDAFQKKKEKKETFFHHA